MEKLRTRGLFLPKPYQLELKEFDYDDLLGNPPRTDMCTVKMGACGICGSDVHYFTGRNPGHYIPWESISHQILTWFSVTKNSRNDL